MKDPIVIPVRNLPYDKNYLNTLRAQANASVASINSKPTLQELYKTVDDCWSNPVFLRQTKFENKDQHYAYITEYYNSYIENATLDEYKKQVLGSILSKIDVAERLLESDKYLAAAKEHKRMQDAHLRDMQAQIDDLKERNESVNKTLLGKVYDK